MNAQQEMTDTNKAKMSARYQRAETLAAGFVTSNLVQNDVLAGMRVRDLKRRLQRHHGYTVQALDKLQVST